jgi:hypothetical protein
MKEEKIIINELKLTRRDFFKFAGAAVTALGAGYVAGKLKATSYPTSLGLGAFLPEDEDLVVELVQHYLHLAGGVGILHIFADQRWTKTIRSVPISPGSMTAGFSTIRITQLRQTIPADLVLSDNRVSVYDPTSQFPPELTAIRQKIYGSAAKYSLSALSTNRNRSASHQMAAVISDHSGLVDRLSLKSSYKDIHLDGILGKTHLRLEDGRLWVHRASCRHKLCQQVGQISFPGERITCAPNRLYVEIEMG